MILYDRRVVWGFGVLLVKDIRKASDGVDDCKLTRIKYTYSSLPFETSLIPGDSDPITAAMRCPVQKRHVKVMKRKGDRIHT